MRSNAAPAWPSGNSLTDEEFIAPISFRWISPQLVQHEDILEGWLVGIAAAFLGQARQQNFWEASHRQAVGRLLDALSAPKIDAYVTKGTVLGYSVYNKPAMRRRGDSDVVIQSGERNQVRKFLRSCGFRQCDDARALQENWEASAPPKKLHTSNRSSLADYRKR